MNGKGSRYRSGWNDQHRQNFDAIFRKKKRSTHDRFTREAKQVVEAVRKAAR